MTSRAIGRRWRWSRPFWGLSSLEHGKKLNEKKLHEKELDKIFVRGLALHARHGVNKEEQVLGQRFILHLAISLDVSMAGRTDRVSDTVSYADLIAVAEQAFTSEWFYLLEKGAEKIAQALFKAFPPVRKVDVTIEKPGAPIASMFETVGVTIVRTRPE